MKKQKQCPLRFGESNRQDVLKKKKIKLTAKIQNPHIMCSSSLESVAFLSDKGEQKPFPWSGFNFWKKSLSTSSIVKNYSSIDL